MPRRADLSKTTLPRRQLGRALRDARQEHNLTLEQVADVTGISRATLSRIELGQYEKVRDIEVDYLSRFYCLPDSRIKYLVFLAGKKSSKVVLYQDYQHALLPGYKSYLELESFASEFRAHQQVVVPGLLQTADYARAVGSRYQPTDPEAVDASVETRMQRAKMLTRRHRPLRAEFLIQEAVLYTLVGSGAIMRNQLFHIADMSVRENVTVRVIPFAAGIPTGTLLTPYIILDFADAEPSIVYAEGVMGSVFFEEIEDIKRFCEIHETLRSSALEEQPSRDRIRKIARRYEK
ncbi:helix-turn-helix domain-containing protein [Nocardia terpenica]|uniref:Helix-turn-helix domain-containing protein n=1 Tax=Nocardia terpenica TaxID=455432 RepID=A0A6G9Z9C5_9NOCA|nr:helix-turn-helix transcriptional regulator [Nocardia terpenica]QIS22020.1 helix-turn-helix domain-containing protein [Nocardia terpenica]